MVKKTNFLFAIYLLFMLLLVASGGVLGAFSEILYCLAFILPTLLGLFYIQRHEDTARPLAIVNKRVISILPLIAPSVQLIIGCSMLASLLLGTVLGKEPSVTLSDSLPLSILYHALLPSIIEETLFRYLPLRLLGESKRAAVIISSVSFALVHHSFFSFGYAFLAGVIFALIDIATESLLPSVILHFVNNTLSVLLMVYSENTVFLVYFSLVSLALCVASVIFLCVKREKYARTYLDALVGDMPRMSALFPLFLLISLLLAALELI